MGVEVLAGGLSVLIHVEVEGTKTVYIRGHEKEQLGGRWLSISFPG